MEIAYAIAALCPRCAIIVLDVRATLVGKGKGESGKNRRIGKGESTPGYGTYVQNRESSPDGSR